MIYDCFIVYNELDLCEIRFNVLKDVVDKFVVVEGTLTHTGKQKPLYFNENKERFAAFKDKIIHVIVDDFPEPPAGYTERQASWMREDWQRNGIARGLKDARSDDIVMICDADEILRPEAVAKLRGKRIKGVASLGMEVYAYYLNYKNYTHYVITAAKVLNFGTFKKLEETEELRPYGEHDPWVNKGATPTNIRTYQTNRLVPNAGWHFSYLGGAAAVVQKVKSIAIEFVHENSEDADWVSKIIERGDDITRCGGRYFAVPIDGRYPAYIRENQKKFSALIYEPPSGYYERTRWARRKQALRGWIRRNGAKLIPKPLKGFLFDHVYSKLVKDPIVIAS